MLLTVVEELASVGHELWLAAIAWGARCVLLADGGSVPGKARAALDQQIAHCGELLQGLGYDRSALRTIDTRTGPAAYQAVPGLPVPALFAATGDKRQLAGLALSQLWEE